MGNSTATPSNINGRIDLIHPLSSHQRKQRLVDGYIRSMYAAKSMPNDIGILCNQYLTKISIKSPTEIQQEIEENNRRAARARALQQEIEEKQRDRFKVAILGAGAVGKTSTTVRFVNGHWDRDYYDCCWDDFYKEFKVDGVLAKMDILDTAGQEQFAALQHHWIHENEAFILMYNIVSERTFKYLTDVMKMIWRIKDVDAFDDEEQPIVPIPVVLVGNKCDLDFDQYHSTRQVTIADGKQLAAKWNCPFFEASAKADVNVTETFEAIVREIRKAREPKQVETETKRCDGCACSCHIL